MNKSTRNGHPDPLQDAVATAEVLISLGQSEAQAIAIDLNPRARVAFAQGFCAAVLVTVWNRRTTAIHFGGKVREPVVSPIKRYSGLVERIAEALAKLSKPRAGFLVGQLYTALLPPTVRKQLGAYYTPPPLVDRLIELVDEAGLDWRTARIIDPACGGAAFLASIAPKLIATSSSSSPLQILEDVEARVLGVEVDNFAAWMSMVLLDLSLLETIALAGRSIRPLVLASDALELPLADLGHFDLIIGNPPYGKVPLPHPVRQKFKESLFGHANLYGLFTDIAVRLAKPTGFIAFVTPTSFLSGEYFKNLRKLLRKRAPLIRLDFVTDRQGVFDGVLQETTLAVFRARPVGEAAVRVNVLQVSEPTEPANVDFVGTARIDGPDGSPWLLPRSRHQDSLVRRLSAMPHHLSDYGFAVSTGQLVWNRHKAQLRGAFERNCYPIVWAEAVNTDGTFHFQAARRTHLPYLKLEKGQDFLLNHEPCILVQRTTAKEQRRRLIAAVIPNSFIVEYPGFIVENHLNMVYSLARKPHIALRTMAALLNSSILDQAFRCMNGSVAVSAFELNSLPLPNPDQMQQLQDALFARMPSAELEILIARFYSTDERNSGSATSHTGHNHRSVAA